MGNVVVCGKASMIVYGKHEDVDDPVMTSAHKLPETSACVRLTFRRICVSVWGGVA